MSLYKFYGFRVRLGFVGFLRVFLYFWMKFGGLYRFIFICKIAYFFLYERDKVYVVLFEFFYRRDKYLYVVLSDFGGLTMFSLMGIIGLEMFWVRYNMGFLENFFLVWGVDRK